MSLINSFSIYDEPFTKDFVTIKRIYNEVFNLHYQYGERDNKHTPPTGLVADLCKTCATSTFSPPPTLKTLDEFYKKTSYYKKFPNLHRSYVNLFAPGEPAFYHTDGNCATLLYYANPEPWDMNEGGETKFIDIEKNEIIGVAPIPGRIVIFDGRYKHSATPFKSYHRFTVAIKYRQ